MKENINNSLEVIDKSIKWVKETDSMRGAKGDYAYRKLVEFRRKLNKKKFALEGNPAAAIYGESQVGKSYLIAGLLSEQGKPFCITDNSEKEYDFIADINPPGGGSESTSLVSRFSVNYKLVNPRFPVKAVLLSPADIVLVLCDSFYNDLKPVHDLTVNWQPEQINAEIDILKSNLQTKQQQQSVLCEDDVLDMQDYFTNYLPKANNVLNSDFFAKISLLISKAKPSEWKDIFSLLWYKNEKITMLFERLIAEYEKLNFSNIVYLPLDSVLYKHGTLLDVKRLKEIYETPDRIEPDYKADTVVLCGESEINFAKSYLCALSAELVFSQPTTLLGSKPFLEKTDLLDFPGARSRLTLPQNLIETEVIPELLLRGKVAYLFNKYSEAEKINVLLFCAKHDQAAQRAMPEMLNNWINKVVGETPEKRESFISKSKIPPLFIIGTFFNVNLQYDPQRDKIEDDSHLNYRWNQRFETTLAKQMLNIDIYQWFDNWTTSNSKFQNIFLLRDFEKSESISHIFRGYNANKTELEEIIPTNYPDFKEKLRQSFIEYPFVKQHFENPAKSWDEAASINKDGTKLIIDKLTIAANNIDAARREKIIRELNVTLQEILMELKKHFHDSDSDALLEKAKSTAGDIQHTLDVAFRADGINRFGQMMKEFMISRTEALNVQKKEIDDIERQDIRNRDIYSLYRMHVPVIVDDTLESYFERLCLHYEKTTEELKSKFKDKLESEGVDLRELIEGNNDKFINFSQQLADALLKHWLESVVQKDKFTIQEILAKKGSYDLENITEMFAKLFAKLQLSKKISKRIRDYVHSCSKTEKPYEMIADISAAMLNECINNLGLEYLSAEDFEDLKLANEKNNLGLNLDNVKQHYEQSSKSEVAELLAKIDNLDILTKDNPDALKTLPNYCNYLLWYNRLKVGFVSVCDIPTYDVQANEKLGKIIEQCETIKY